MQQQLQIPETQNLASPEIVRRQADTQKEEGFQEFYKIARQKEENIQITNSIKLHIFVAIIMAHIFYVTPGISRGSEYRDFFGPVFAIFSQVLFRYLLHFMPTKKLYNELKSLASYNDLRSVGFYIRLAEFAYTKSMQNEAFAMLKPLLEAMTKKDVEMLHRGKVGVSLDVGYVKERHQNSLRNLAKHPRIRREFPELMQAIIVALYNFHTAKDKEVLEKIAKEKPKREAEQWIPKAAQSCLDAWGAG
jgi:hypothetical protein